MYKAWFKNIFDETFTREFKTSDEMDKFIERVLEAGTKLIGFVSIK